uniref:DDE Tnp4 domain-containing protein n=1 Tax=Steinernema glaseri TaxID=37863 RepID=A0A1I7Y7J5_9BILA
MDFVPAAFVDALCTALNKEDLEQLQKLRMPWSSTVTKHCGKRRNFTLCLDVNHDGTQVGMGFSEDSGKLRILEKPFIPYTSLTKYDRIGHIMVGDPGYEFTDLLEKMPLRRFKTDVLPLITSLASSYVIDSQHFNIRHKDLTNSLFSSLQGYVFTLATRYAGKRFIKFIEQRSLLGGLRNVIVYRGIKWPESGRVKAAFITLLKSPKFSALSLSRTDVKIDFDMVACLVERFFRGDLPRKAFVGGKFSRFVTPVPPSSLCDPRGHNLFPTCSGCESPIRSPNRPSALSPSSSGVMESGLTKKGLKSQ